MGMFSTPHRGTVAKIIVSKRRLRENIAVGLALMLGRIGEFLGSYLG
jgi:hypothetical protein